MDFEELEHDLENIIEQSIYPEIDDLCSEISQIVESSESISISDLRTNSVAIIGPPNSGKSSLINFLLGENVSIVSDLEGTTRDTVEKNISFAGNEFKILDLAGLRDLNSEMGLQLDSHAQIEQEGIKKALSQANKSENLIVVIDCQDIEPTIQSGSQAGLSRNRVSFKLKESAMDKYSLVFEVVESHFEENSSGGVVWLLNKRDLLELKGSFGEEILRRENCEEITFDSELLSQEHRHQKAYFTTLLHPDLQLRSQLKNLIFQKH